MVLKVMGSKPYLQFLISYNGLYLTGRFSDIFYMRKSFRTLFTILTVSAKDASAFVLILVFILFMFGVSSYLMELGSSSELRLIETTLIVFTHALGGSGFPENEKDENYIDSVPEETFNQNFSERIPMWFFFMML